MISVSHRQKNLQTKTMHAIAAMFLSGAFSTSCSDELVEEPSSQVQSLTSKNFKGRKFYLGWGHAAIGDRSNMHNEVKYDVLHTHDIFTKNVGGSYTGAKLVGHGSTQAILQAHRTMASQMTEDDMFIQYSSGHGFHRGLEYGGSYEQIASRLLQLPAKEIISFTMACHSGGLVDTFNRKRAQWADFEQQGRTLFVMTSSTVQQESRTGPGRHADEPGGPYGSAGSAFGHALWMAFKHADGYVDGVKDGFVDLGEIEAYVKDRTRKIGGHTPVVTGVYNPGLIMSGVVGRKATESLSYPNRGTSHASVPELRQMIEQEDLMWLQKLIGIE